MRNLPLVGPAWLIVSGYRWERQPENKFPVSHSSASDVSEPSGSARVDDTVLALAAAGAAAAGGT